MYYKYNRPTTTSLNINKGYTGETIEHKMNRILSNKEPIKDGAPIIYTERKDGVKPQYDIRTDRFELAVEAMDKVTGSNLARREMTIGEKTYDTMNDEQKKEFNTKYPTNKYNKISKTETTNGTQTETK